METIERNVRSTTRRSTHRHRTTSRPHQGRRFDPARRQGRPSRAGDGSQPRTRWRANTSRVAALHRRGVGPPRHRHVVRTSTHACAEQHRGRLGTSRSRARGRSRPRLSIEDGRPTRPVRDPLQVVDGARVLHARGIRRLAHRRRFAPTGAPCRTRQVVVCVTDLEACVAERTLRCRRWARCEGGKGTPRSTPPANLCEGCRRQSCVEVVS